MKQLIVAQHRGTLLKATALVLPLLACTGNVGPGRGGSDAPGQDRAGSAGQMSSAGGRGGSGTGGSTDPGAEDLPEVSATRFARLTHAQWENAVRDLLRLDAAPGLAASFLGDPSPGRFDDDGNTLQVTSQLRTDYEAAAETLADRVAMTPAALAKILPASLPSDAAAKRRAFLQGFGLRAYRRPVTDAELTRLEGLFQMGATIYKGADPFVDGVRLALRAFLQSPQFLYRAERAPAGAPLDAYDVAAKLSLTLARTIPDDDLLAAAAAGKLKTRDELRAQAERLLGNGRLEALLDDFHHQALRLKSYATLTKDAKTFPAFATGIGADLRNETLAFARDVVTSGGAFTDLMTAPRTFVTARTAPIYGVAGSFGDQPQKVQLDPATRAGLLTQLGFLASNAGSIEVDTGLIHRGVFIMRDVLCTDINPPSNIDFANLPPGKGPTNRARMDDVTSAPSCKGCHHSVINPLGGAFEGFDAIGRARTTERDGAAIDTRGSVSFGALSLQFEGPVQLAGLLARDAGAQRCYAGGWLEYLHGHLLGRRDGPLLADLVTRSRAGQLPIRSLIVELATADTFLTRQPQ